MRATLETSVHEQHQQMYGRTHKHPFTVSRKHLELYATLTGDTHALHTPVRGIVPGALTWGQIGAALTGMLGDDYVCIKQSGEFLLALCADEPHTVHLRVSHIESPRTLNVICWIANHRKKPRNVLEGHMLVRRITTS